jgi:pullulanase/glycogen debranching enzyme
MDNDYTSPELFTALDFLETYVRGTLRRNRKLVLKAFQQIQLRKGYTIFRRMGNLFTLKFKDKQDVHMLSSFQEAKLDISIDNHHI